MVLEDGGIEAEYQEFGRTRRNYLRLLQHFIVLRLLYDIILNDTSKKIKKMRPGKTSRLIACA